MDLNNSIMSLVLALTLVGITIAVHYEVLRQTSVRLTHIRMPARMRIIFILIAALISHLVHVLLYAIAFYGLEEWSTFGTIDGPSGHNFGDAFYFSITSYTTLGIGDLFPTGAARLLSGIEALNGLVMVGWTASMTYLYMEKFWHLNHRQTRN